MADLDTRFHETWLGMVQPTTGLVVSLPVLVDAQCMAKQTPALQEKLLELCPPRKGDEGRSIADLSTFLEQVLELLPSYFDAGDALAPDIALYVPEGQQTLRPSLALKRDPGSNAAQALATDSNAAAAASANYIAFVWDLPEGLDLDKAESVTGSWEYPPAAKFDRLLRHCQVPIGLLTNRRVVRLVYAPHRESSGSITFRIDDMASVGGRPIFDAFVMLLHAHRFFSVAETQTLPAILIESRKRQADVTNELAEQVLDAIQILLRGFEVAAERDQSPLLREAIEQGDDHVYGALLTVLLRLVFVLYAEDWGLLPVESDLWEEHYSVLGLFAQLQSDRGQHPDSMSRRFGAYSRLIALFRAVYLGVQHGKLRLPPRRGHIFDPERFAFLEGWPAGGGAPVDVAARAAVRVPSVDDETVFLVLQQLIVFQGQRLSYRALDVEQLGSVYEALMGYHVVRLMHDAVALKVKSKANAARAWVEVAALLEQAPARRATWLEDELGFDKATAKKATEAVKQAGTDAQAATEALLDLAAGKSADRRTRFRSTAGRLVLQPGPERRRTSSHYTPRELSAPIVRRTLEPLLAVMGEAPASARILNLKVCDPAMGSGAFLVEACRHLGDEVVKAWTREGALPAKEEPVLAARRLVAQRCLYGVDKNPYAVDLAKLSLWLVTLARELPFTFLDHALRHGDSLVGLDFTQIRAGHWKAAAQLETAEVVLREALDEAIGIRQEILALARDPSPAAQREKERKLGDADDALKHARLLADIVVGAFFAQDKDKAREQERNARVDAFVKWRRLGDIDVPEQLQQWQQELRTRLPAFHWMLEFPEVFYAERPDPLDENQVNRAAHMDAFVGNPPFAGKNALTEASGGRYLDWLLALHEGAHGNADLSAHFFRRVEGLLGNHGTIGLIATNTIAQGDTRDTALKPLVQRGLLIYDATRSLIWPGDAAVAVSVVHLAKGNAARTAPVLVLDGAPVSAISSRLRPTPERADPRLLATNAGLSFVGSYVLGMGFTLTPEEREAIVRKSSTNSERIFPYLGGEEVNSNPDQSFDRYVINFGQMTFDDAARWPDLIALVREKVKPERDRSSHATAEWWHFERLRPELYASIAPLTRCLVTALSGKHRAFVEQPTDRVLDQTLIVFALDSRTTFVVLQSRVHELWSVLVSGTIKDDQRYNPSRAFQTFPFPQPDPRTVIPELEDIGQRLYDARARYMLDTDQGLTKTYNQLKDPTCTEPRVIGLRRLHEELDAAVLAAYGWTSIPVPPYCPATDADKRALEAFETEVIDHLFVRNEQRAEQERLAGAGAGKQKKAKAGRKKSGAGEGQTGLGF